MGLFSDQHQEAITESRERSTKIITIVVVFIIGIAIGYFI